MGFWNFSRDIVTCNLLRTGQQVRWDFNFPKSFWTFWTCHKMLLRSRDELLWNCHYLVPSGSLENSKTLFFIMIRNDQVHIWFERINRWQPSFNVHITNRSGWFGTVKSRNGQVEFVIGKIHLVTIITTVITYFCPIFVPIN